MGELTAKMRSFLAQAALSLSVALVLHAQFGMADWNVNVGSNINSAPVVVNDPLLDFGAVYVSDYAQHRVCECFYNGTCRDFVQKGSGGLKWPWGLEFGHHDNGRGQNTGWDDRDKMYVASEGTNSIILYNAANGVLKKSPFANVPGSPRGVKYFRQSIYVASYHKHAVYRFNARTGAPSRQVPPCRPNPVPAAGSRVRPVRPGWPRWKPLCFQPELCFPVREAQWFLHQPVEQGPAAQQCCWHLLP